MEFAVHQALIVLVSNSKSIMYSMPYFLYINVLDESLGSGQRDKRNNMESHGILGSPSIYCVITSSIM